MEPYGPWDFWSGDASFGQGSRHPAWGGTRWIARGSGVSGYVPPPKDIELQFIAIAYECETAWTTCERCRAYLRADVEVVVAPSSAAPWWCVQVVARCRGFRRHRHLATVTDEDGHLRFGAFHIWKTAGSKTRDQQG